MVHPEWLSGEINEVTAEQHALARAGRALLRLPSLVIPGRASAAPILVHHPIAPDGLTAASQEKTVAVGPVTAGSIKEPPPFGGRRGERAVDAYDTCLRPCRQPRGRLKAFAPTAKARPQIALGEACSLG